MNTVKHPEQVKAFVQRTLGCGCPESVFQSMKTDVVPLSGLRPSTCTRILVGDRLLVCCAALDGGTESTTLLEALVDASVRCRDDNSYNRVRLVLFSSAPPIDEAALGPLFEALRGDDDRLHLHVLPHDNQSAVATGLFAHIL